jgi:hypothetical protein
MSFTDPGTLCLFLLAVIAALLVFRTRARLVSQRRQSEIGMARNTDSSRSFELPSANREAASAERPLPGDLAEWEVQMHETARELSAQLDAKLSLLQALTAEADRVAERLEELLERADSALSSGDQADALRPSPASDREGFSKVKAAGAELDCMPAEAGTAEGMDRARRREEIYQLADYGFGPAEIARRVGSPVGEVELILSLRQK